jgi:hypothetical protein
MTKEQALQIIKQVVDQAIANGVFKNTENAATAIQALQIIVKELTNSK